MCCDRRRQGLTAPPAAHAMSLGDSFSEARLFLSELGPSRSASGVGAFVRALRSAAGGYRHQRRPVRHSRDADGRRRLTVREDGAGRT
jgi:hypothetical protein